MSFRWGWLRDLWVVASRTSSTRLHFTFRTHWVKKPSETSFVRTLTGERKRSEMTFRTSAALGSCGEIHLQSQPSRPHSGPRPARCLLPPSVQPNDKNIVALSVNKVHVLLRFNNWFYKIHIYWSKIVDAGDRNVPLSPPSGAARHLFTGFLRSNVFSG